MTADEARPVEPPCCSDPTCTCDEVNAEGRCDCTKWESGPQSAVALRAQIAALQARLAAEPSATRPLRVGQVLHGFCGGVFGRDHYECSRVEHVGRDWVVVRADDEGLSFAAGERAMLTLRKYRAEGDHCPSHPCPVQPGGEAS